MQGCDMMKLIKGKERKNEGRKKIRSRDPMARVWNKTLKMERKMYGEKIQREKEVKNQKKNALKIFIGM